MGLVRFVTTTGAGYSGITSKDKDTLYFISDECRIYKGEVPYSGGIFITVAEFPETGEVNTLYVNSATGEVRYYNGTSYQTVVPATGKSITGKGDGSLATTAAVAAYVTSHIGDLNISALKGRVDTLEGEMDTAQGQITTINGEGDGSIKKAASDAVASAKSYTDTVAAGKANTAHTHKMADVAGLSDALAGKANAKHTHAIADVTGLQTALSGKADKATTLAGYGIGDAYTKNETDTAITTVTADASAAKSAIDAHASDTGNPHNVTKVQVGLGNVDNTADADKYVKHAVDSSTVNGHIVNSDVPANAKFTDITAENIKTALGYTPVKPGDLGTETTQVLPSYTNQIPLSTDASGSVLNGVGYQSDAMLDGNGAVTAGTSFVSGFIHVKKGDVIRVKDPSSPSFNTGLIFAMYKSDKATGQNIGRYIKTLQGSNAYGAVSISGNVLTWDTTNTVYWFWNDFAYLRVTTNSADSIVTINQEIVETTQTIMTLNPAIKVGKENLNFAIGMPLLSGRKVVVFGDSIIGMTRDETSVPAYASAYTGAEVYNVGFGGCRMAVHPTSGYAAFSMWALADAVASGNYTSQDAQASNGSDYFPEQLALLKTINFSDVDMIVIHYGTNDFAGNVTIDNTSDDDDTATLCGALRYSLRKFMNAFPKIRIFVSVPIYRKWESTGAETYTNSSGKKLRDFCEALAGVASEFNLPVIDGYKALGINTINDAAFSTDGTHLNDHGRRAFGELIGGKLISPV